MAVQRERLNNKKLQELIANVEASEQNVSSREREFEALKQEKAKGQSIWDIDKTRALNKAQLETIRADDRKEKARKEVEAFLEKEDGKIKTIIKSKSAKKWKPQLETITDRPLTRFSRQKVSQRLNIEEASYGESKILRETDGEKLQKSSVASLRLRKTALQNFRKRKYLT